MGAPGYECLTLRQEGVMGVNAKVFSQAMEAALEGPEKKFVKFRNHDFHIRPIKKTSNGNGVVHVEGHMFHQLALRPDDKIIYSFDKRHGLTENLDIRFEAGLDKLVKRVGEVIAIAAKVIEAVGEAAESGEKSDTVAVPGSIPMSKPATETLKLIQDDDGWKAESRFLIANVAVRVR